MKITKAKIISPNPAVNWRKRLLFSRQIWILAKGCPPEIRQEIINSGRFATDTYKITAKN